MNDALYDIIVWTIIIYKVLKYTITRLAGLLFREKLTELRNTFSN